MSLSSAAGDSTVPVDLPVQARLTRHEAAHVLGCLEATVRRYVYAGAISELASRSKRNLARADVERLAGEVYDWRKHYDDPGSYWVTDRAAAEILGLSLLLLRRLTEAGRIPYVRHRDGTRLYRRRQLETVSRH